MVEEIIFYSKLSHKCFELFCFSESCLEWNRKWKDGTSLVDLRFEFLEMKNDLMYENSCIEDLVSQNKKFHIELSCLDKLSKTFDALFSLYESLFLEGMDRDTMRKIVKLNLELSEMTVEGYYYFYHKIQKNN